VREQDRMRKHCSGCAVLLRISVLVLQCGPPKLGWIYLELKDILHSLEFLLIPVQERTVRELVLYCINVGTYVWTLCVWKGVRSYLKHHVMEGACSANSDLPQHIMMAPNHNSSPPLHTQCVPSSFCRRVDSTLTWQKIPQRSPPDARIASGSKC